MPARLLFFVELLSVGLRRAVARSSCAVYLPVMQLEEQHLRGLCPEYAAYAARVPALAPRMAGGGFGRNSGGDSM